MSFMSIISLVIFTVVDVFGCGIGVGGGVGVGVGVIGGDDGVSGSGGTPSGVCGDSVIGTNGDG